MSTTLLDVIVDSLTQVGQLGIGQSVSPEEAQQALRKANRMLATWSLKKLLIYVVTVRPFALSATVQDYTVGPSGGATFAGTRPVFVESGLAIVPGSSMQNPLNILTKEQWDSLPDSGVICGPNGTPASVWPEYTYPNLAFHVSPIPSTVVQIRLGTWEILQQFVAISDVLNFPPGYERAIMYNLAVEIAGDYDQQVSPDLAQLAADALNSIQTNNAQKLRGGLGESQTLSSPNVGIPPPSTAPGA